MTSKKKVFVKKEGTVTHKAVMTN